MTCVRTKMVMTNRLTLEEENENDDEAETHTHSLGVCCCCHWLRMFCVAIHVGSTRCFTSWKSRRAATHETVCGGCCNVSTLYNWFTSACMHTHTQILCVCIRHTLGTHTQSTRRSRGFIFWIIDWPPFYTTFKLKSEKEKLSAARGKRAADETIVDSRPLWCCSLHLYGGLCGHTKSSPAHHHPLPPWGCASLSLSLHNTNGKKETLGGWVGFATTAKPPFVSCEVTLPYWKTREVERWGEKLLLLFCWWFPFLFEAFVVCSRQNATAT